MATIRGTTLTFTITLNDIDLSEGYKVYVTIDQSGTQLTKTTVDDSMVITSEENGETVSTTITLTLTQKETLLFKTGGADVQIKWIDHTGNVSASNIGEVSFDRALLEDVIEL